MLALYYYVDEDLTNEPVWNPTPEQFARYQAREVVMARENIAYLSTRNRITPPSSEDTLHSPRTFAEASR